MESPSVQLVKTNLIVHVPQEQPLNARTYEAVGFASIRPRSVTPIRNVLTHPMKAFAVSSLSFKIGSRRIRFKSGPCRRCRRCCCVTKRLIRSCFKTDKTASLYYITSGAREIGSGKIQLAPFTCR